MSLATSTVWEIRTGGSATNGGGFVAGAAGTDWSQQDAAQYSLTNGVTNATTTIGTTSASADMVGNIAYVAGGTGSITGAWYQIVSQVTSTSITVDRLTGLTAGTGVTINVGGALNGPGTLFNSGPFVVSNRAYMKAGTYSTAATIAPAPSTGGGYTTTSPNNRLTGYATIARR